MSYLELAAEMLDVPVEKIPNELQLRLGEVNEMVARCWPQQPEKILRSSQAVALIIVMWKWEREQQPVGSADRQ